MPSAPGHIHRKEDLLTFAKTQGGSVAIQEKAMDNEETRLRQAIDDLHRYVKDPRNPLICPDFSKLLEELYAARNAMIATEVFSDSGGL